MNAAIGMVIWLILILTPLHPNYGIGTIEKLFLLAPLVIVPLGLRLVAPGRALPQLLAAVLVVASFFFPQGWLAASLVAPWAIFTGWCGLIGLVRFWKGAYRDAAQTCCAAALLFLPVGGMGLLQSRLGLTPLGYGEPVVLLVAVHFHFAAFVSPIMAGAAIERMRDEGRRMKWLVAGATCLGSPMLAAGYTLFVPALRLTGATLLVVGLFGVALMTLAQLPEIRPRLAQVLLSVSAGTVVLAMLYACVYAMADFYGQVWIAIPHMARTHGVLQALGFSLCGLLGWTLVRETPTHRVGLQSLTRRWS